jgi:hypothetical protein
MRHFGACLDTVPVGKTGPARLKISADGLERVEIEFEVK